MTYTYLKDNWNQGDEEFTQYIRELWWTKVPQRLDFILNDKPGESQETYLRQIAYAIVEASPDFVSVKCGSRGIDFNLKTFEPKKCCVTAFITEAAVESANGESSVYASFNPVESANSEHSVWATFTPVESDVIDHLIVWIGLWLWD